MILRIYDKPSQKAIDCLRGTKGLPLIFKVAISKGMLTVEVEDDESEYVTDFLEAKGFSYENEDEETVKEKKATSVKKIPKIIDNPSPDNGLMQPWPPLP
jgi:hypothetical protein